ncbi:Acetoacetyl-CoA reductase (EC [Kosakonia radicincitans]|uniref:acetoacetyl-CoA reductase n=1 Tax=Kosakonia radicincitans TaxID=283686 RepID=UPI001183D2C9|nr:acetoacetyl-CoA reductase [Kosakonia radicincitans]VVT55743.1 Acetoacetyl-CoA reductase (EC [Kosakonia radicincitans]
MEEKIALVTGGIRGIGEKISLRFLKEGYQVVAFDNDASRLNDWAETQKAVGFEKIDTVVCDVSNYEQCQSAVASVLNKYGHIDVLVNNAGITRDATFKKMDKSQWDAVIQVNLNSMFNMTKPVIDNMLANQRGRIINMSSINGQKGQFGQANYSAAKAGVHGFTKALAQEVARKNITVNTISPGYINTEMMQAIPDDVLESIKAQIPVGRLGEADEIAELVLYLCGDKSGYITGSNIAINGGQHMC